MKPMVAGAVVMLLVATAGARKKPATATYEYTGTVRVNPMPRVVHHETEGSFTDENGTTTTVYCDPNLTGNGVDCGVGGGHAEKFHVTLDVADHGVREVDIFGRDLYVPLPTEPQIACASDLAHMWDCDPLAKMASSLIADITKTGGSAKPGEEVAFRYRRVWVNSTNGQTRDYTEKRRWNDSWEDFCIPLQVTDHQGQTWKSEACYRRRF